MKRNIGKDLSKVSMPVVLNEPIGTLKTHTHTHVEVETNCLRYPPTYPNNLPSYYYDYTFTEGSHTNRFTRLLAHEKTKQNRHVATT
jgi:hypothetical protein